MLELLPSAKVWYLDATFMVGIPLVNINSRICKTWS